MKILDCKVDNVTKEQAIAQIAAFLDGNSSRFMTTPNSEILLYAHSHPSYREIINHADLAVPDGAGLLLAAKIYGEKLAERVSGSDLLPEICRLARQKNLGLAVLGGLDEAAIKKASETISGWGGKVVYAGHGIPKALWNNQAEHEKIINELAAAGPAIIFAGFGHPKQEEWIEKYRHRLPSVKLFLGCGGALDFVAGRAKRAPVWMRPWFEWLWRLITDPRRLKRIWNATVVFQLTVIYDRFRKK